MFHLIKEISNKRTPEVALGLCQTSIMELFNKKKGAVFKYVWPFCYHQALKGNYFCKKRFIVDVWQGPKYASEHYWL